MNPEMTAAMLFLGILIMGAGFPIAFRIRRFERPAWVIPVRNGNRSDAGGAGYTNVNVAWNVPCRMIVFFNAN